MSVATNLLPANTSGIETNTSGWTAGANTTLAQSTRFYQGAHSLQLTAVSGAFGVSATTSARVSVNAGDPIMAYAYFANVVAAATRTASVSVAFFSTVTGGTAIATVNSSTVALANNTNWLVPPPIVLTTVPAGATYAQMTVVVNGLTTGAAVVMDEAALGPPALIPTTLLTYNTQGAELDASGWTSVWQSTVSRDSVVSFEGWYSLTLTSTAAGAFRASSVAGVPVTPGTEYFVSAWVYAPHASAQYNANVRWYDASGTQIGSKSQPYTVDVAAWTRCAVIDTAPAGAATGKIVLEPVALASGETWHFDQMAFRPAPLLSGNLIGYNAQSVEADASAWAAVSGCTVSRSTARAWEGVASLAVATSGGDATIRLVQTMPVIARQAYKVVPEIYSPGPTAPVVDLLYTWLNAAGATIGTSSSRWTLGTAAGWYAPIGSGVAPSGATTAQVAIRIVSAPAGTTYYLDNALIAPGGLGAVADSIDGLYGARVSLQGLTTGGYTTYGLWRMLPDGTTTPVRGYDGDLTQSTITGDVAVYDDYEAPLGIPLRYMVRVWTGSAYISATSSAVTLPEPPDTQVVIKDPALPARWTLAVVSTLPDWQRQARQGVNPVRGRARPIVISDVRTSRTGSISIVTETDEERDQFWWLVETGNTLLIQWPSTWHESDMYVSVGDVTAAHATPLAQYADREWTAALTEVDRPVGGIVGSPVRTWQDVLNGNADWLSVLNGANSWLDVLTGVRGG